MGFGRVILTMFVELVGKHDNKPINVPTFVIFCAVTIATAIADSSLPSASTRSQTRSNDVSVDEFVCFNTILEIVCDTDHVIVFDSARYGRNHSTVAAHCDVPYTRNCDIDVHFSLNRACAGKPRCSMAVNTAFFGDPCGYDEFLRVTYRCIPATSIVDDCGSGNHPNSNSGVGGAGSGSGSGGPRGPGMTGDTLHASVSSNSAGSASPTAGNHAWPPTVYDHGYVASPNYPGKYYLDTDCRWRLVVQRQQTIRITLYDFELDVKRAGRCHEFLEIVSLPALSSPSAAVTGTGGNEVITSGRVYFRDCGSLGKQMMTVDSSEAMVRFKTGQASLAQRGFLLYFEGVGPGCSDMKAPPNGRVQYYISDDAMFANVTCEAGYQFDDGSETSTQQILCTGTQWKNNISGKCSVVGKTSFAVIVGGGESNVVMTTRVKTTTTPVSHLINRTASLVGIALSIASAILLVVLLLTLALYFHRRCHIFAPERRHIFTNNSHCHGSPPSNTANIVGNPLGGNGTDATSKYTLNKRGQYPGSTAVRSWVNLGGGTGSTVTHQSASPHPVRLLQHATGNCEWVGYDMPVAAFSTSPDARRNNNNYRTLPLPRSRDWPVIGSSTGSEVPASMKHDSKRTISTESARCCSFATSGHHKRSSRNNGAMTYDKPEILSTFRSTGIGNTHVPVNAAQRLKMWQANETTTDRSQSWTRASSDENNGNEEEAEKRSSPKSMRLLFDHRCARPLTVQLPNICPPSSSSPNATISVPDLTLSVPTTAHGAPLQRSTHHPPAANQSVLASSSVADGQPMTSCKTGSALIAARNENLMRLRRATNEMTSSTDYLVPPSSVAPLTSSMYGQREENDSSSLSS